MQANCDLVTLTNGLPISDPLSLRSPKSTGKPLDSLDSLCRLFPSDQPQYSPLNPTPTTFSSQSPEIMYCATGSV
ncbi:hypothetical protein PGTUg99_009091 [Puccinia graminis f. sp. tritici]|uniref:Uncharacterized protein n=1 Tax=Puccinia graminis f. sp. tritici TaxID=56615 RepID=A0A5B0MX59_PUCGR|nr:hypothetical protein PGTUg99_009091 [Puccinia graminis f. sp. tritici]